MATVDGTLTRAMVVPDYAGEVLAGLKDEGIRRLVYVPDSVLAPIIALAGEDPDVELTSVTREEEGFGLVVGSQIGGEPAALLIQSTGLGNSLNVLGSLVVPYRVPCPIVVSLRGEIGDRNYAQVPFGSVVPRVLELMGVQTTVLSTAETMRAAVAGVVRSSQRWRVPTAAVLTRAATGGVDD